MRPDKYGPEFPLLSRISRFLGGNRKDFFDYAIQRFLSRYDPGYALIQNAYNLAKTEFDGVFRQSGDRYFEHLRDMALIGVSWQREKDPEQVAADLTHDIIEDIPGWTPERLERALTRNVAYYVDCMTKPNKQDFPSTELRDHAYHLRLDYAPLGVKKGKLRDRLHNLMTLDGCPLEKRIRKIAETEGWYLATADKYGILYHELLEAIEWAKKIPAEQPA